MNLNPRHVLSVILASQLLPGCGGLFDGKGVINHKISSFLGITDPNAGKTPTDILRAGVLAIGEGITAELKGNLTSAGLTDTQAEVVAASAKAALGAAAGKIAISSLRLADQGQQPILYTGAPIVQGAVSSLSNKDAGLDDLSRRTAIAKVVMGSTFSSLGGRVSGVASADLLSMQKGMVGSAVKSLNDGGLGGAAAAGALQAVTSGAVEALAKSVDANGAAAAAAGVAAGAVESLTSDGLPLSQIGAMVSAATAGVVASLKKAGVTDTSAAVSNIAKTSVTSLKGLALSDANVLAASSGAASGAISGLTATGVGVGDIAAIAKQVATASVGALKDAGVSAANLGKAAGAVASGAIEGLGLTGMTPTQIAATNSVSSIVAGAAGGLAASGIANANVGSAIGDIASSAVTAMSTAMKSAPLALQQSVMGDVMKGSAQSIASAGMNAADALTAMTSVSQKSVEALPPAVFSASALSSMAATVVGQGLANALSSGIVSTANASKMASTIGAAVGAGAASSGIGIDANAMLKQVSAAATAAGVADTSTIMTAAFSGASTGAALSTGSGSSAILASLSTAVSSGSAFSGLSVDTTSLSGNLQQAVTSANTLATTVSQGALPDCSVTYPNSMSNDDLWTKVKVAPQPVICASKSGCPMARADNHVSAYWTALGSTGACQFVLTVNAASSASALLPTCAQISAKTSIVDVQPLYNATYGGVPCMLATAVTTCPALQSDADSSYSWVSLTVATPGDACLLTKSGNNTGVTVANAAGTGAYNLPYGLSSTATVGACPASGFGLAGINAMTTIAGDPTDFFCAVALGGTCPSLAASLSNYFFGPDSFASASKSYCHYYTTTPSCSSLFATASATISNSQALAAANSTNISPTGDLSCYVNSGGCPALPDATAFTLSTGPYTPTAGTQCSYSRVYPICSLFGGTIYLNNLTSFAGFSSNRGFQKLWACDLNGNYASSLTMDSTLIAAGFDTPVKWGYPNNGMRIILPMNGADCATIGITGTITASTVGQLAPLGSSFNVGCDVPLASSCPTLGADVSGFSASSLALSTFGINRCIYTSHWCHVPMAPLPTRRMPPPRPTRPARTRASTCCRSTWVAQGALTPAMPLHPTTAPSRPMQLGIFPRCSRTRSIHQRRACSAASFKRPFRFARKQPAAARSANSTAYIKVITSFSATCHKVAALAHN